MERNWSLIPEKAVEPDFNNLLAILLGKVPSRPTLFEFFLNEGLYQRLIPGPEPLDQTEWYRRSIHSYCMLGYDCTTIMIPGFRFTEKVVRQKLSTVSLNEGTVIHNRREFDEFEWPDPDGADYDILDSLRSELPHGMKLILFSPDGILENVINLMGYEGLCLKIYEDRSLVEDVFEKVGSLLVRYYENASSSESIGACIANDDWGFQSSTLLAPEDMRHLVFPWHKKIVEAAHSNGKPAILHSCGYFEDILDDIVEEMGFDGRHSYEDKIFPVEEAYEFFHDRIAIIGGIDVDFICRESPEKVYQRSKSMLERTSSRGGYAHGTGNSVPEYVPDSGYFALISAALDMR
ncbi:uroporphyrinogen decarboxylase family protein [Acidobacteriota bacterium]